MTKDMLRALLFFFMLFLTILAFLELFSVLPDSFGSVEQTSALLSLIGIFALMAAFWIVGHTKFMTKLFFRPLMVSYRKALRHSGRKPSLKHQDFFRALAKRVSETALDDRQTPASLLSDARVGINLNELSWPWDFPELEWWAKNAAERINSHLLLRFLLSDQLKAITKRLHLIQLYAARFPKSRPVEEDEEPRSSETQSLVEAIEQYTGASILAEGHDTRSGVSRVRLWHSNAMGISAESVDKEKVIKYKNYRQFHRPHLTKERATLLCAHDQKMRENEKYRTGDFDRHLVVARGVTVIANNETGEVEFLISSHSTCYAASDHSPARCKGALHEMSFGSEPVLLWERSKGISSRRTSADNSVLMESIISLHIVLIIVDKDGNRSILFIERGTGSRFGNGIWSLPGAVLNMPSGQIPLKTHEFGGIDIPSQLVQRLQEVLGLEVAASTMQPTQVFMVNQRESHTMNCVVFDGG